MNIYEDTELDISPQQKRSGIASLIIFALVGVIIYWFWS